MSHSGIAMFLRRSLTEFGSEFRRKKGELTIGQILSKSEDTIYNSSFPINMAREMDEGPLESPSSKLEVEHPLVQHKNKSIPVIRDQRRKRIAIKQAQKTRRDRIALQAQVIENKRKREFIRRDRIALQGQVVESRRKRQFIRREERKTRRRTISTPTLPSQTSSAVPLTENPKTVYWNNVRDSLFEAIQFKKPKSQLELLSLIEPHKIQKLEKEIFDSTDYKKLLDNEITISLNKITRNALQLTENNKVSPNDLRTPYTNMLDKGYKKDALDLFRKNTKESRAELNEVLLRHLRDTFDNVPRPEFIKRMESDSIQQVLMAKTLGVDTFHEKPEVVEWSRFRESLIEKNFRLQNNLTRSMRVQPLETGEVQSSNQTLIPKKEYSIKDAIKNIDLSTPPSPIKAAQREVFFDIENTIPRPDSKVSGQVLQFGAKKLEGELLTRNIEQNLGPQELSREIDKRMRLGKATVLKSSLLDIGLAEIMQKNLERGSVSDLVASGLIDEAEAKQVSMMSSRAGMNSREFLRTELSNYLSTTTRMEEGNRVFKSAYEKQAMGLPIAKSIGSFYQSEKDLLLNVNNYISKLEEGDIISGHNILAHDIPVVISRSKLHGLSQLENMNDLNIIDTLKSNSEMQVRYNDAIRDYQNRNSHLPAITSQRVMRGESKSGPKALQNIVESMGLFSPEITSKYEHISPAFDADANIAAQITITKGNQEVLDQGLSKYLEMAQGNNVDNSVSRNSMLLKDVSPQVAETYNRPSLQMIDNLSFEQPVSAPRVNSKPMAGNAFKKVANISESIFGSGVMNDMHQLKTSAGQVTEGLLDSITSKMNQTMNYIDNKLGGSIKTKTGRSVFAGIGILSGGLGAGTLMASSLLNMGETPSGPRKINKPVRSISGDDQEHRLMYSSGADLASSMRHGMTDFGSGYQGMAGSMLGHIKTNIMNKNKLSTSIKTHISESLAHIEMAATESPIKAANRSTIVKPIEHHGKLVMNPSYSSRSQSSVDMTHSPQTLDSLSESIGSYSCEISKKKQKLMRKKKFIDLGSQGTRSVFELNENRIGHRRM